MDYPGVDAGWDAHGGRGRSVPGRCAAAGFDGCGSDSGACLRPTSGDVDGVVHYGIWTQMYVYTSES